VVDELEDGFTPNVPLFKALTGSDTVTINPKNRRPYPARTTATFAMATNGDWRMPAGEAAGWARLYVVNLEHARQVPEERADKQASERLAGDPAMRRCALRFLVEGARDLLECGGAVSPPARAELARERMRRESNTLHEPLELEVLRVDPQAETATGDLLRALHEYARDTGRSKDWAPSAKQLARDLRALNCTPAQVGAKGQRLKGWRGIALGPESPRSPAAETGKKEGGM
jgi:phage/plasmid-associated DNA primase